MENAFQSHTLVILRMTVVITVMNQAQMDLYVVCTFSLFFFFLFSFFFEIIFGITVKQHLEFLV